MKAFEWMNAMTVAEAVSALKSAPAPTDLDDAPRPIAGGQDLLTTMKEYITRPVRVVILSTGLVFAKGASLGHFELLAPAIYVLAGLSAFTTLQRIWHVRAQLRAM